MSFEPCLVIEPLVQTLAAQDTEFDFRHIEPTAMLGCVVQVQPTQDALGLNYCNPLGVAKLCNRRTPSCGAAGLCSCRECRPLLGLARLKPAQGQA